MPCPQCAKPLGENPTFIIGHTIPLGLVCEECGKKHEAKMATEKAEKL